VNLIKNRFLQGLAVVLCALQYGYAQKSSSATVRINYFSNSQSVQGDLLPDTEFIKKSSATLENIEILPTYRSGNAFIINMPEGISPEVLKDVSASFTKTIEIKFIEDATTLLVSWPPGNDEITKSMFDEFSNTARTPGFPRVKLKNGYIFKARLPDGRDVEAFSDRETISPGDWFKILMVNTHLKMGPNQVVAKSFVKLFGGSGLLSDMATHGYMDKADINIGLTWQPSNVNGLPFGATMDLWNETKSHIYAFTPYDLPILNSVAEKVSKNAIKIPELILGNISLSSSTIGGYGKRYTIKEVNGVKIGFFFVLDNKARMASVGPLPAELSDPVGTSTEIVKILVDKEKVDVVVMLAMFDEDELQTILSKIPGVDIVINNSSYGNFYSVIRTNLLTLENWGDEIGHPAVVADLPNGRIGKLQLEFSEQDGKKRLTSVLQGSEGMDFAARQRNEYDNYDDNGFIGSIASGARLLPDPTALWSKDKRQYTPLEIFNLGAVTLNEKTKAEIAFLKIRPFSLSLVGEIPESVIRHWFQHWEIITAELDGAAVRALLKQMDFDHIPVSSDDDWRKKYTKGSWLAVGGVSKDGRVGGIPLNNNEIYKVSFSEDLLAEVKDFPALGRIKHKLDTDLYLDDIVVDQLLEIKKNSNATSYEQLRKLMAGTASARWKWRLNVKEAALQFSETQVANTAAFSQVPNSKLQASNQMFMQNSLRLALESRHDAFWDDTKVSLDYGKIILNPIGGGKVVSETADQMLFENEMRYAALKWDRFGGAVLGPLVSLGYNTEFTHDAGIPRRKIVVGKAGVKVFEGRVIQDFYSAAVIERDFTYPDAYTKLAWEMGTHLGGLIGGIGPEYSVDISYKRFSPNRLRVTDLKQEFDLAAKLKIKLFSDLSLNPFADFYSAKGVSGETAHNYIFGISLDYSRLFKIRN